MKRKLLIFVCILVSGWCLAQNSGGMVKRPSNNNGMHKNNSVRKNMSSNNGIKRNIGGILLGETTMQEIMSNLNMHKIKYEKEIIAGDHSISYNKDVSFGGVTWDHCSYTFFNNIVYDIRYIKVASKGIPKETIDMEYSFLIKELSRIYRDFSISKTNRRGFKVHKIRDENTIITIEVGYQNSTYLMSIDYMDLDLSIERVNRNQDEL